MSLAAKRLTAFSKNSGTGNEIRIDIQSLRGFAVLVVLMYHAKLPGFDAGFLGVDVFFVISGFLITGLVSRRLEQGAFSFWEFYLRRARRLLPAAFVTFLVTAIAAPFLLGSAELLDFRFQALSALTFLANVVLWRQSGYFGSGAELKPLLHIWSLSLEEQYYLVVPALLAIATARLRLAIVSVATIASFALCVWMVEAIPSAAFYLLPSRAWELGIGSIVALCRVPAHVSFLLRRLYWLIVATLLLLCCWRLEGGHPGWQAVAVCCLTAGIIIAARPASSLPGVGFMPLLGGFSYSLYLAHWPLFAFLNNAWVGQGDPPLSWRLGCLLASFVLGWLLHKYVEEPFRNRSVDQRFTALRFACASLVLMLFVWFFPSFLSSNSQDFSYARRANVGLGFSCGPAGHSGAPAPECQSSADPSVLVWGDSYAMHLVPGLIADGSSVVQAAKGNCAPMHGAAVFDEVRGLNEAWGEACIAFNDSVLEYAITTPSIRFVVLSSPFRAVVGPSDGAILTRKEGRVQIEEPSIDVALERLGFLVERLRKSGKRVIVFSPPPATGTNFGRCFDRLQRGQWIVGGVSACQFMREDVDLYQGRVWELMGGLRDMGVPVVDLRDGLCTERDCRFAERGIPLYRDGGHLSVRGSELLATRMRWTQRIEAESR